MRIIFALSLAYLLFSFPTSAQDKPTFQLPHKFQADQLDFDPENYDILGIKVGATLEDVVKQLEKQGYSVQLDRERKVSAYIEKGAYKGRYDSQPKVNQLKATKDNSENISFDYIICWFTSNITGSRLYLIQRNTHFVDKKGPEYISTIKAVEDKYGTNLNENSNGSLSIHLSEDGVSRVTGRYADNDMSTNIENIKRSNENLDWLVSNIVRKEDGTMSQVDMIVTNIYGAKLYRKDKFEVDSAIKEFSHAYESAPEPNSNYGEVPKL